MEVIARIDRFEGARAQLAAAQAQTEAALGQLAEAQARTEARLEQLVQAQVRTEEQLGTLLAWQRGEGGRREGERYERDVWRQAPRLFQGGEGGPTHLESVQRRLTALLAASLGEQLPPEDEPLLADLLWWKGERAAVVEVSRVVDEDDVNRAHRRAATIRRAGAPALAIVIGEAWADGEARAGAEALRMDWKVGSDLSEGFLSFRQL